MMSDNYNYITREPWEYPLVCQGRNSRHGHFGQRCRLVAAAVVVVMVTVLLTPNFVYATINGSNNTLTRAECANAEHLVKNGTIPTNPLSIRVYQDSTIPALQD
jgi:hypothetical protein